MNVDKVVQGGTLVTPERTIESNIAIKDSRIAAIGESLPLSDETEVIDASGKLVMPGVVDPHVHIDGQNSRDTYLTASRAAALGGVTTCINFAWQGWDEAERKWGDGTLSESIDRQIRKGSDSIIDFGLHGTITRENDAVLAEIEPLVDRGITSFKMFTAYEFGLSNGFINKLLGVIADTEAVALFHTEEESVCATLTAEQKAAGTGDPSEYPSSRPDYAEAMAADSAVRMAQAAGAKYYGVHTSCEQAAKVLAGHIEDGTKVRAETCTHYLARDESAYGTDGTLPVIAPPLRTPRDQEHLFTQLAEGALSVVSTDHVATTRANKEVDNWWDTSFGANSLQYSLPVFHEEAVNNRGFSYPFLVRTMCSAPANTFGMQQKGTLDPGTDADLILFDPDQKQTIDAADNESIADYSIYEGRTVSGKVTETFLRGERIAKNGTITSDPGYGEFLKRDIPNWSV
ncbi:dihydroorotase [Halorubrum trueperi]|uniref:Dihydroorotase family protein n=1 Tax=Halorubrum trueperi TaxID=2004704 RepID=A0ABD5UFV9_9EURY